MRLVVTGASGFVGLPVCRALAAAGHDVRAVVRSAAPPAELASFDVVAGCDLEQHQRLPEVVRGADVVVHLAARAHVMHDDPQRSDALYQRANVHVMQGLAAAAVAAGVKRFVFVSSIKVNGERTPPARPFTPDDAPAPQDAYGRSKLAAERLLRDIAGSRMDFSIVRPPLLYGPRMRGNMLRLFRLVEKGVPLPLGSIRNARDLLFVGNLAGLVEVLVHHPQAAGRVFLVRDGMPLSTPGLVRAIGTAMGRAPRCLPFPVRAMQGAARLVGAREVISRLTEDLRIDDDQTRSLLGWQPQVSTDDALALTARWFQSGES